MRGMLLKYLENFINNMKKFLTILLVSWIIICIVILSYVIDDDDKNLIRIKSNDTYFTTEKYDTVSNGIIFFDHNQERMVEIHGNYIILKPND